MPPAQRPSSQTAWGFTADDYVTARRARHEFTAFMRRCAAGEDAAHASALIFGELVGNAIRHAGGCVRATLRFDAEHPVLCVTDRSPNAWVEIPNRGPECETGRGLQIVHKLARRVWIERGATEKTICAELPCELSAAALETDRALA